MDSQNEVYLLPFKNWYDLEESYNKIKESFEKDNILLKKKLREAQVPYEEIGDIGISIDIDKIPEHLIPQQVLLWGKIHPVLDKTYSELNITKQK